MRFKRLIVVLAGLCLVAVPGLPAHAAGGPAESWAPVVERAAASTPLNLSDSPAPVGPHTQIFDTATSPFVPDTPNQGWWSTDNDNYPLNANYVVGGQCGGSEFRNFFTFDLRSLDKRIVSASLRINTREMVGQPLETLRLHDVTTDPERLNSRLGRDEAVFADLGTGKVYGTYTLSTEQDDVVVELKLNRKAVRALNRAQGDFFSIGGRLVSLGSHTPGVEEQFMFSNSSRAETVQLVTQTRAR